MTYDLRLIFTSVLLMFCLSGCSQVGHHDFHDPRIIPIDAKRWYQLNDPNTAGMEQLFNGKPYEKPNTGWGKVLENYDAYYPLLQGEQMTIDSIEMFDWEGTNENHPMTIYAVLDDWQRLPIAVFTGMRYEAWNGPDPKNPDVYALKKPVSNIRYLVINSWGDYPGEIEFYGTYAPPKPASARVVKHVPLNNFFGVNAFEWDFLGQNPIQLDPIKIAAIQNFTGIRHYMDWDKLEPKEGIYTFNPTESGTWNYDTLYQWCQAQGIEVLACLKTIPPWMRDTYPKGGQDDENIPIKAGKDAKDPASYIEQARVGFQYAARYGNNKNIAPALIKTGSWNHVITGLGCVHYIECDNERDKWWKGRKAYQTGREYAANLSAFYDGNKHKMGPGVGVKNADTSMKVVMAGLADPDPDYVRGMIDWCKEFRGYKPDGSADLPWDVINYHFYSNDQDYDYSKKQTTGIAPELSKAAAVANGFIQMSHIYANDMPVWITEAGYDINQQSKSKAIPVKNKTALETQADWILRTSLLYSRAGIQKVFYYELNDDRPNSANNFGTSGLINPDRTNRPAADYLSQVNKLFGAYTYAGTLNNDPIVDQYKLDGSSSMYTSMYMLVVPDEKGRTAVYALNLPGADAVYIYRPKAGSKDMQVVKKKVENSKVEIDVTETPVFVITVIRR